MRYGSQEWSAIQQAATSTDPASNDAALPGFVAIVLSCIVGTGISYFGLLARSAGYPSGSRTRSALLLAWPL